MTHLETARLILRPWQAEDREPFARLNADPQVMEHFPSLMLREESDAFVDKIEAHFREYGYGFWALEDKHTRQFLGFTGLRNVNYEAHFAPAVEVGWRLAKEFWTLGFATEAARASLAFGFETLQLKTIVAVTVPANIKSRRVMDKLGMKHDSRGDFEHPRVPEGSPLRRHVLYRAQSDFNLK